MNTEENDNNPVKIEGINTEVTDVPVKHHPTPKNPLMRLIDRLRQQPPHMIHYENLQAYLLLMKMR